MEKHRGQAKGKVQWNGQWIVEKRLKHGNSKLGKAILTFDLPAVDSCKNCESCKDGCYAVKAQVQYPYTREWRNENFEMVKNDLPFLEKLLINQLDNTRKAYIRIHSSGEYWSQEYIDMWTRIARRYPEKRFFSYTKVEHLFDFSEFRSLPNVNVIPSFIKGKLNFGPIDYVKSLGAPICPNTLGADIRCEKCGICIRQKHVAFVYHDSMTARKAAQAKKKAVKAEKAA